LIIWQDASDHFYIALAIAVEEFFEQQLYTVTYVRDQRIKSVNLFIADRDKRWRVLHDSA
jgi:hypothetical protein